MFDLELGFDNSKAAASDNLKHTIDYEAVNQHIIEFTKKNQFQLIEALAEKLASSLIKAFKLPWLKLTVTKPGAIANAAAWEVFRQWQKPFLTAFSDSDPITAGGYAVFQREIPGAQGQNHATIEGAGHFLQEQKGEELARVIADFMRDNPL